MVIFEPDTPRLKLRQWRLSDLEPFARLNADPQVMAHFPKLLSVEESRHMINNMQLGINERGWGFWALELKETAAFMGFVGLHVPVAELPFTPCVEIGWRLASAYWGQGYATEAAQAALRVGFVDLGLEEILSFTALSNQRSQAVMQRLGMQRDPDDFEHPHVPVGHPVRWHCLYRLNRAQYQALWGQN